MGIKELFKSDKCISCGEKLEVFAWKRCRACSTYRRKTVKKEKLSLTHFSVYDFGDVSRVYKIPNGLKSMDLNKKEYLVYDPDTFTIIGWK